MAEDEDGYAPHMPDITIEHPDVEMQQEDDGSRTAILTGRGRESRVLVDGTPWFIADDPIEIHAYDWHDKPGEADYQGGTVRVTLTLLAEHLHIVDPHTEDQAESAP